MTRGVTRGATCGVTCGGSGSVNGSMGLSCSCIENQRWQRGNVHNGLVRRMREMSYSEGKLGEAQNWERLQVGDSNLPTQELERRLLLLREHSREDAQLRQRRRESAARIERRKARAADAERPIR